MKIFGFAGWSGSGKTTLVTKLIPELVGRGVRVSTMKHAHHTFDIDQPGKDSYEHRTAGATEVMVTSASRWALMHEARGGDEPSIEELAARMMPVDLLLIEGFKAHAHDKIEVYRAAVGKPLLCPGDEHIVAVASDAPVPQAGVPVLDLNDIAGIADFILERTGLKPARGAA
jgi:molybdopterin-guanine dinucleotide biosynthesis adapter protein